MSARQEVAQLGGCAGMVGNQWRSPVVLTGFVISKGEPLRRWLAPGRCGRADAAARFKDLASTRTARLLPSDTALTGSALSACSANSGAADGLRAAIDSTGEPWRTGRYGEQARALLARQAARVTALMTAYGELVGEARTRPAESWKNLEYFLRPAERWPQLRLHAWSV